MTTIIAIYDRHRCVGFCSAKCYNAMPIEKRKGRSNNPAYARSDSICDCICGGANHGMGLTRAVKNRQRRVGLTPEAKDAFAREHNLDPADLVVIDRLVVQSFYKARRLVNEAFNQKPLPLFECEGLGVTNLSEGRRRTRKAQHGAGTVPTPLTA